MNFEKFSFPGGGKKEEKKAEEEKAKGNFGINVKESIKGFISVEREDLAGVKQEIDTILGEEWNLGEGSINVHIFSNKEELRNYLEKANFPEKKELLKIAEKDSAFFHMDLNSKEYYVFIVKSLEEFKKFPDFHNKGDIRESFKRQVLLPGIAHEMTHMHSFFEKHGNERTKDVWEQEMICNYTENKVKGDVKKELIKSGIINKEKTRTAIEGFTLKDGEWENYMDKDNKEKQFVVSLFYPFLIKEHGIKKTRGIWKSLQENPDINLAIKEKLDIDYRKVEDNFRNYLKEDFKDILS